MFVSFSSSVRIKNVKEEVDWRDRSTQATKKTQSFKKNYLLNLQNVML